MSGAAQGLGTMAMAPMQPQIETRAMGAAMQRTSQNWVTAGPDIHPMGRGLSQEAGRGLAQNIRQMAGSQEFQAQTGGAFNREDLTKMTSLAGRTGLMDMEQSLPQIKDQLQRVSRTVSAFMQLTSDPDVTSVIRQMGQLRGMGMSMPEIESAAYQMKAYARAAGTSIGGMQAQGGLPGAATFQQAGLSPAAGFGVGMHAMASARQAVSTGTFTPMQLAMQGGVSGVAQRNVQAQAAYMSTPLFAAAAGGYQDGKWQMDPSNLANQYSQGGGVQGMVTGAIRNIGQGVQQGGVGALANFGLMQKEISSTAAQVMTPGEMNLMRFRGAMQTGQMLGQQGSDALSMGAQAMYGPDIARQMMMEAANPEYWRAQQRGAARSLEELGGQQYADIKERAPGMWDAMKSSRAGRGVRSAVERVTKPIAQVGGKISDIAGGISEWMGEEDAWESGQITTRRTRGRDITEQAAADFLSENYQNITAGGQGEGATSQVGYGKGVSAKDIAGGGGPEDISNRQLAKAVGALGIGGAGDMGVVLDVAAGLPFGKQIGEWGAGRMYKAAAGFDPTVIRNTVLAAQKERERVMKMSGQARKRAGASVKERVSVLEKIGAKSSKKGDDADIGAMIKHTAAQALSALVHDRAGTFKHARITSEDRRKAVLGALSTHGISEEKIPADLLDTFIADATNAARANSPNPREFEDSIATTDAETALEHAEIGEAIRDKRLEDYDKNIDVMQRHLGLREGLFSQKIEGVEDLEGYMQKTDKLDIQGLVAVSGDDAAMEAMRNVYAKSGRKGSFAEFLETSTEQRGKLSEAAQKALGVMGKRGARGIAGAGIMTGEVQQRALSGATPQAVSKLFGGTVGEGFQGRLEGYEGALGAEDIFDAVRAEGMQTGSGGMEEILSGLGKGGKQQQAMASALREFGRTRSSGAGERVMKSVVLSPEELLKKESAYRPKGPEAARLEREGEAARSGEEEFGEIVRDKFGPAAENLLEASKKFNKESGWMEQTIKLIQDATS
jgi:hypothetical protein